MLPREIVKIVRRHTYLDDHGHERILEESVARRIANDIVVLYGEYLKDVELHWREELEKYGK